MWAPHYFLLRHYRNDPLFNKAVAQLFFAFPFPSMVAFRFVGPFYKLFGLIFKKTNVFEILAQKESNFYRSSFYTVLSEFKMNYYAPYTHNH